LDREIPEREDTMREERNDIYVAAGFSGPTVVVACDVKLLPENWNDTNLLYETVDGVLVGLLDDDDWEEARAWAVEYVQQLMEEKGLRDQLSAIEDRVRQEERSQ
jgi:hypothetical protein